MSLMFAEEKPGWSGYKTSPACLRCIHTHVRFIEWQDHPEKKAEASTILNSKEFSHPPEFQLVPLPKTNPVLTGKRWKQYHYALGLSEIVEHSWDVVQQEKPNLIHLLDFPYNGETKRDQLLEGKLTDNKYHFVRNHGGIPNIEEQAYELEIGGLVHKKVKLTLQELKDPLKFPGRSHVRDSCASWVKKKFIILFGILRGTAVYRGVSLKKVLKIACGGVFPECKHLEFIGADTYFKKNNVYNYAVSVPWRKVRQGEEVLLAWEMNGKPLPKIHGAPLRVVVAGYIGARSTKWVYKINALAEPSRGPVQQQEYLYYTSQIGKHNAKFSNGFSIQQMPVSSAILYPEDKQVIIHGGKITLRGWSYSGGGNWVERVEVSPDGGSVWYAVPQENLTEKHYHAWRLWRIDVPVDAEGWLEFCVRTWDSSNNTEPTFVRSAWNWDLHVTSSCHRIKIYSVNMTHPATAARLKELESRGVPFEPLTRPLEFTLETQEEYSAMVTKFPREPID
ncbi:hypothetical protein C0992_002239 [Termitomyces sp. T32_za158]|nr:hypothetical protein C0992_002239 [Termitomyces sp. T32_za158]